MLYDPARHEPLAGPSWDEARARAAIAHIVRDTEARFVSGQYWPLHPRDIDGEDKDPAFPLYHGAAGVIWALHYLRQVGACDLARDWIGELDALIPLTRRWLASFDSTDFASVLMGETGILMLAQEHDPQPSRADRLAELIEGNLDNPTREVLWGSPGTMMAALFLFEHTGDERWARLFRITAEKLWSQLLWSQEYQCHYWTQDMYGRTSTYIDAVHGFAGTAQPLIRGRALLEPGRWALWQERIATLVTRTAAREGDQANWRAWLYTPEGRADNPTLMQFCHGAPGFVLCMADFPGSELDALMLAGGEATWAAGPLTKGANLCHGTAGNGYAFLKLFERTGDEKWLQRARAFAMHGILQSERDEQAHGRLRYSLWTGDLGLAIYLWDCIRAKSAVPTFDLFFSSSPQ